MPRTLNPRVASLNESKTMVLTDLARAMKEEGKPVRHAARAALVKCCRSLHLLIRAPPAQVIGLAAGEPDFDTPAAVVEVRVSEQPGAELVHA